LAASDKRAQREALDEFGGDEMHAPRFCRSLADLVNDDDVRVVERRSHASLLAEPPDALSVCGEARRQQLERDLPAQQRVARQVDLAHASAPDLADDLVVADRLPGPR